MRGDDRLAVRARTARRRAAGQPLAAIPDPVILLAVAALTETAVAAARVVALARADPDRETI